MNEFELVIDMLRGQVFQAIERAPRQARKDLENVESFLLAVESRVVKLMESDPKISDLDEFGAGLATIGTHFVDGLISMNPSKMSLAWFFKGFDPFKPMRLEADRFAVRWQLNWSRK